MTGELDWSHAADDIPEAGLAIERKASPAELQTLARALELVACSKLTVRYKITPQLQGHYRLTGTLDALVEQTCVVTLEPLTNAITEKLDIDFWPEHEIPAPDDGEVALHDEPDLEPIVAGRIPVGSIVFESLAAAIDLFPRKPGATLDLPGPSGQDGAAGKPASPFAVLARLKNKS